MDSTYPRYSVLMSLYAKERVEYLCEAVDSVLAQTIAPAEIVVVKDGPLPDELDAALFEYSAANPELFKFVAYPENRGLGYALARGIEQCSNEIVARMDTDDHAFPERMERQLAIMEKQDFDMVGSNVTEFIETWDRPIAKTELPISHEEISVYAKRRNPFRHPPMTFRRSKVLAAGNYNADYPYFEDWDLFNRMLASGCRAANVREPLVAMRVSPDFYARRGGREYLGHSKRFKLAQLKKGYFSEIDFLVSFIPQAVVCLLPNGVRSLIYSSLLRSSSEREKETVQPWE